MGWIRRVAYRSGVSGGGFLRVEQGNIFFEIPDGSLSSKFGIKFASEMPERGVPLICDSANAKTV